MTVSNLLQQKIQLFNWMARFCSRYLRIQRQLLLSNISETIWAKKFSEKTLLLPLDIIWHLHWLRSLHLNCFAYCILPVYHILVCNAREPAESIWPLSCRHSRERNMHIHYIIIVCLIFVKQSQLSLGISSMPLLQSNPYRSHIMHRVAAILSAIDVCKRERERELIL